MRGLDSRLGLVNLHQMAGYKNGCVVCQAGGGVLSCWVFLMAAFEVAFEVSPGVAKEGCGCRTSLHGPGANAF